MKWLVLIDDRDKALVKGHYETVEALSSEEAIKTALVNAFGDELSPGDTVYVSTMLVDDSGLELPSDARMLHNWTATARLTYDLRPIPGPKARE